MPSAAPRRPRPGFTIIELLVVVSIIALLIGVLLPAIGKARDQAKLTGSFSNLRNLGAAHGAYEAEWKGRQFSLINDNISSYGNSANQAFTTYRNQHGGQNHPPVTLGWGYERASDGTPLGYKYFLWPVDGGHPETRGMIQPIVFDDFAWSGKYFGSFRLTNCTQFNQYVNGRFYDPVFFAPKDDVVIDWVKAKGCWEDPGEFCATHSNMLVLQKPVWCTYILSPAAMFSPGVLANPDKGGFQHPWSDVRGGFRAPASDQARYPSLKTRQLEHHWLQNRRAECNPGFSGGSYNGCEPYYFNHAWESAPATLFYDGHISTVGARAAERADGRSMVQSGYGLWSRDTPFGDDGYLISLGYDLAATSFHVLTTDGILGRDLITE